MAFTVAFNRKDRLIEHQVQKVQNTYKIYHTEASLTSQIQAIHSIEEAPSGDSRDLVNGRHVT